MPRCSHGAGGHTLFLCSCLLLLLFSIARAASPLVALERVAARRYVTDDGLVTALLAAGHVRHSLALRVTWPDAGSVVARPPEGTTAAVQLVAGDMLLATDVPGDWYDGATGFSHGRVVLEAFGAAAFWPVGVTSPAAVNVTGSPRWRGLFAAGSESTYWLQHSALVFSGATLQLLTGAPAPSAGVQARSWTLPGPDETTRVRIEDALGHVLASFQLAVAVDPDSPLTRLPQALYTELTHPSQAPTGGAAVRAWISTGSSALGDVSLDLNVPVDAMFQPDPRSQVLVLGRRWLQTHAVGWTVDARPSGSTGAEKRRGVLDTTNTTSVSWTLVMASTSELSLPMGARIIQGLLGLVFAWLYSYWAYTLIPYVSPAHLGHQLPLGRRPLVHAALVLLLSVPAHVLAAVYAGRGLVIDTRLVDDLPALALTHALSSLPLWLLLLFVSALLLRRHAPGPLRAVGQDPVVWWARFVFVGLHALLAVRSLVACLMLEAGLSGIMLFVLVALVFVGVLCQAAVLLGIGLACGLAAPSKAYQYGFGLLWWLSLLAQLGALVAAAVAGYLWLLVPFLHVVNDTYSDLVLTSTAMIIYATAGLAAAFVIQRETLAPCEHLLARHEQSQAAGKNE